MSLVLGAVLVGGQSRRMGEDKALLSWEGKPLAIHVARCLSRVCHRVVLIGGTGRDYEGKLEWPWWPDPAGLEGAGPMAGLISALTRFPDVLLVGCDLPNLTPPILRRLLAAAGEAPVAVPLLDGRPQPLVARYRRPALQFARASLTCGSGRMADLLRMPGARVIPGAALGASEEVAHAFRNLNRPADLD